MRRDRNRDQSAGLGPSQRQLRVGEELRHALAWILERGDIRDPALHGVTLTVTEVRVSPDLRNATAFVMRLGGGDMAPVLKGLDRVRPYLRHQLAGAVKLKFAPDISFEIDKSFDEAGRIEAILKRPEVAKDLSALSSDEDGEASDPEDGRSAADPDDGRGDGA